MGRVFGLFYDNSAFTHVRWLRDMKFIFSRDLQETLAK